MDPATCMYYTGIDPATGEPVYVPKGGRERRLQRALLQFWKPENYADVREALAAGRPAGPDRRRAGVPDPGPAVGAAEETGGPAQRTTRIGRIPAAPQIGQTTA